MKRKLSALILSLVFLLAVIDIPKARAALITITADYNTNVGNYNKSQLANASQGGYVAAQNLNFLPEQYDKYAEAGLQLIRLDHLYDPGFYDIVQGTSPNFTYNWTKLDRVILPLLNKGMTPFISLSYTPSALGAWNAMPSSMTGWSNMISATVQHYKDLGYTGWYWEVWNEPDNFFTGSQAQYNTLYDTTVAAVKAVDATAKVGGSGEAAYSGPFLASLLNHIQAASVPFDFVSYHAYGETDTDWSSVDTVQTMLNNRGLGSKPIFVTEWNSTYIMNGGPGTPTDTNVLAAYAARKMYLATNKTNLAKIFFFSPSEGYTPTKKFNGDLGLLTVDNHRKAVFNVLKMYSNMNNTKISTIVSGHANNQTYGFATKDASSTNASLIAWNNSNAPQTFTMTFNNLPYAAAGQNIQVTGYLVDANHANYYRDYARGITGYSVGPTESMDPIESSIVPFSSTLTRTVTMTPYSVIQYKLAPTANAVTSGPIILSAQIGSPDLAADKTVTTSSSAENWGWYKVALTDQITHSLMANEGNGTMGWSSWPSSSVQTQAEWATVDLGAAKAVNRVVLYPRDDQGNEGIYFPIDFTIQGSNDNVNYQTLASRTNYNNGNPVSGAQTVDFSSANYRYIRITGTKLNGTAGNYLMQLAEMKVYNTAAQTNMALSAVANASSIYGTGYEADKANDGNSTGSRWNAAASAGSNEWLQLDFPNSVTFGKTIIKEAYNRITGYKIQYWNGSAWVDKVTGTTIGASKTDTFSAVTTTKVRLYVTSVQTDAGAVTPSIWEFEVYP